MLFLGQLVPQLAIEVRPDLGQSTDLVDAARRIDTERRVIDRQNPAQQRARAVHLGARAGHGAHCRQYSLGDTAMNALVQIAKLDRAHAALRIFKSHTRHQRHLGDKLVTAERAMQDRHMERVHHVLIMLKPVARHDDRPARTDAAVIRLDELARVQIFQHVIDRQDRLLLRRSHIGEDQAIAFLKRIVRLAHLATRRRAHIRLARLFDTATVHGKHPTVVAAADTLFFDTPVIE